MKNNLTGLLTLAILVLYAFPALAQTAEASIRKTCLAETQAWLDADYAGWAATHAQHENETVTWINADCSVGHMVGWTAVSAAIKADMASRKKDLAILKGDNFKFIIRQDMAFAVYDQTLTAADGKITSSQEHRSLILQDGQWKIVAIMAFYDHSGDKK